MHLIFSPIQQGMSTQGALGPLEILEITVERGGSKGKLQQPLNSSSNFTSVIVY